MKYVILRDDDTNALTPIDCLERLYRPFLDRGLPVNLATIPNVNTKATKSDGNPELFLIGKSSPVPKYMPIGSNQKLVEYLQGNPGYKIVQHGCAHEFVNLKTEFSIDDRPDICRRLDEGMRYLQDAGFEKPTTFVSPYDRLSKASFEEVSRRFKVLSTGWYELRNLPISWIPNYAIKKICKQRHWRANGTTLLTHPGCHLSFQRPYPNILDRIKESIDGQRLTVLVTHWWEYFREPQPDEPFISILHETAAYLATRPDVRVISFNDLTTNQIPLN
ncbi:MAG: DUF2334 domain-containing protein [Verrucomicrobia bacterium]|nr:DUF2334 domain-containing protein [Verrucomicrobiota bacterium]